MKKHLLRFILLIGSLESAAALHAQDSVELSKQFKDFIKEVDDSIKLDKKLFSYPKKSYLEAGISYLTNNVYLGRKDSSVLPYITPSLTYYHKSGVYLTASAAYLQNSTTSRFDLVTFEVGYMFFTGNYDGAFSASQYYYNAQSTNVTSEIQASVTYQNGYDFGFIKPTLTTTVNFSSKPDFLASFGLEHTFYVFHDVVDFTPSFVTNASTQNYYNDYYEKKRYSIKRKGKKPLAGVENITGTVLDASAFKVLDYEASIPIYFRMGKFTLFVIPTYALPVHPAVISIHEVLSTGITRDWTSSEQLESTFFCTMGAYFRF
jgi:hypothetical protein